MTDSTDNARGPERIFVGGESGDGNWWVHDSVYARLGEYIRADLAPDPLADARLAVVVERLIDTAASLAAAISLLERGGKKAAASDTMFAQMLVDYSSSLDRARAALAAFDKGRKDG